MKLSAPLYLLKSRAKDLKRTQGIPITQALDLIAASEGYSSWSLLQAKISQLEPKTREDILDYLNPGDLMLIGARPGLGKTRFALALLIQALSEGRPGYFFSLEYNRNDITELVSELRQALNISTSAIDNLNIDLSDDISAEYIIASTQNGIESRGLIVVDYLQLLDQKRSNPEVQTQVLALKTYAKDKGCIVLFISQLDRSFDTTGDALPKLKDVRMPNEFDINMFNKLLVFHHGKQVFLKPKVLELTI